MILNDIRVNGLFCLDSLGDQIIVEAAIVGNINNMLKSSPNKVRAEVENISNAPIVKGNKFNFTNIINRLIIIQLLKY